jgi:hypothetical protein
VGDHKVKFVHVVKTDEQWHHGRCACGETSGQMATKQMVEDWDRKHQRKIEKIRGNLRGNAGSLDSTLNYYLERAADVDTPQNERELWQSLADGLGHRLHLVDTRYSEDIPLL